MKQQDLPFDHDRDDGSWWTLHADGASLGNPGPAGAGAVLHDQDGLVLAEVSQPLGRITNNQAEYRALILGLEQARLLGAPRLKIVMDSELVVRQVRGEYRVKNKGLKPLYDKAIGLLQDFRAYDILHVRRDLNAEADALASRAARRERDRN